MDVIYYVALSLDGYIATRDGKVDWLADFQPGPTEDYGYQEFFEGVDTLIMGKNTYDQVLTFGDWPYGTKPTWVCSSRPIDSESSTIQGTTATPNALVDQLSANGARRAWLVGGTALATSFYEARLITQFHLYYIPITLGEGLPLLKGTQLQQKMDLLDLTRHENGVVGMKLQTRLE